MRKKIQGPGGPACHLLHGSVHASFKPCGCRDFQHAVVAVVRLGVGDGPECDRGDINGAHEGNLPLATGRVDLALISNDSAQGLIREVFWTLSEVHTHEPTGPEHTVVDSSVQKVLPHHPHARPRPVSGAARHQHKPAHPIFLARVVNKLVHGLPGLGDQWFHEIDRRDGPAFRKAVLEGFLPSGLVQPVEFDGRHAGRGGGETMSTTQIEVQYELPAALDFPRPALIASQFEEAITGEHSYNEPRVFEAQAPSLTTAGKSRRLAITNQYADSESQAPATGWSNPYESAMLILSIALLSVFTL
ncbi:hypothetical protein V493_00549 [Pseudogymnoascus sp. VKM F-4281 (FW-2241)]|nr:hypothetical protein V493_00549 [Pseudogymnoascus sp. VKM F-4281 (FW-2241)]